MSRRKVVKLQHLSVCPCGFPLLKESIAIGTEYEIDLDTLRHEGWNLVCGGCGKAHRDIPTVMASQTIRPELGDARLPYSVFVGSRLDNLDTRSTDLYKEAS